MGEAFVLNADDGSIERRINYITRQAIAGCTEFNISGAKTKGLEFDCKIMPIVRDEMLKILLTNLALRLNDE